MRRNSLRSSSPPTQAGLAERSRSRIGKGRMERVIVDKDAEESITAGHLWVFSNQVRSRPPGLPDGEVVEVAGERGRLLGTGYHNAQEPDRHKAALAGAGHARRVVLRPPHRGGLEAPGGPVRRQLQGRQRGVRFPSGPHHRQIRGAGRGPARHCRAWRGRRSR